MENKKIIEIIECINNGVIPDKNNKFIVLDKIFKIYNSDLIEIRKIDEIRKYYKSSGEVMRAFSYLEKYCDNEIIKETYEKALTISNYLKLMEEKNLIAISKDFIQKEKDGFFEDYSSACQLATLYLDYNESVYMTDFYETYKITESTFMSLMEVIKLLNPDLYEKVLEKYKNDRNQRKMITVEKYRNLCEGIKEEFISGNPYDKIEAFKNLPFSDDDTSKEILCDFNLRGATYVDQRMKVLFEALKTHNAEATNVIDYLHKKSIISNHNVKLTLEDIYSTNYIINGRKLTNEDKDAIINYMQENKLPFIVKAFNEVRNRYLDGSLYLEKHEVLKK